MISFFRRKSRSTKERLEERYDRILSEVHEFTTQKGIFIDQRLEQKLAEAQKIFHQLSKL
ncbi:hypothetical protein [Reichenbachiella sp.]|uniref:hypothetical protein n=1 Tax=Reichenbachiella sp. TaxID=2184521 RepID=UPI003BB12ABB